MPAFRLIILAPAIACIATVAAALATTDVSAQDSAQAGAAPGSAATGESPSPTPETTPTVEPAAGSAPAARHPGLDAYTTNCISCHTVGGGPAVGPDLAGLFSRVPSRAWAVEFIKNPSAMIAKDEYAKALRSKYALEMTGFAHLGDRVIEDLLDFIEAGGPGLAVKKVRESTPADIELGRRLFTGESAFASGAPACISCHTLGEIGGLGGGTLASAIGARHPDLSGAAQRSGGENGLRSALAAPQFMVMNRVFADTPLNEDEVIAVSAYLTDVGKRAGPTDTTAASFALWGVLGAALILVLMDIIWLGRFRGVRKALVGDQS
jgi:mono/diheme cytochrome c family protein